MVFKKTVSSHTDVVGEATETLQSVPVVVVTEKCDGLKDDLLWRFFSFSCTLFHFLPYF